MKKTTRIIMWVLTGFMGLSGILFFPSIAAIIMILFAIIAAPIGAWQEKLSSFGLHGLVKAAVLCAAFLGSVILLPPAKTADQPPAQPSYHGTLPSNAPTRGSMGGDSDSVSPTDVHTPQTEAPAPEKTEPPTAPAPTMAPTSPPINSPVTQTQAPVAPIDPTTPQAQQTQAPPPTQSGNQGGSGQGGTNNFNTWDDQNQQNTSAKWVLNTSTMKIHYPSCPDVRRIAPHNYSTSNLSETELLNQGYTTCGRCH